MAAEGGEKTEAPTPRRRQDARKKGQVARSPELSGAVGLLVLVVLLHASAPGGPLLEFLRHSLGGAHHHLETGNASVAAARVGREAMATFARSIALVVGVSGAAGVAVSVAQVGFLFTTQPLLPDFSRVNPLSGAARLLGPKGMVETAKAILKMGTVGLITFTTIRSHLPDLVALITLPGAAWLARLGAIVYELGLRAASVLFVLAVADYAYQRWEHEKSLKMSKEEIKQEYKQSEGDPHVRAAIKQRQRDMARKRMMADVPGADVIITNPTHFAVALAYDMSGAQAAAPRVVAKGADNVAARIRELARANDVALVENPPLARALHKEVEVGQEIPPALYAAVAEVLAYVYEQERKTGKARAAR